MASNLFLHPIDPAHRPSISRARPTQQQFLFSSCNSGVCVFYISHIYFHNFIYFYYPLDAYQYRVISNSIIISSRIMVSY